MTPVDTTCTVLIVGDPQGKPIRLRLSQRIFKLTLALTTVLALAQLALLLLVAAHLKETRERHALRSEISTAQEHKATLLSELTAIKKQVLALRHLNWRFSVMLGEDVSRSNAANGQGGEETTAGLPSIDMERELEWLKAEAISQEHMLKKHVVLAEEKSARWASTPTIRPVKGPITSGFGERISPFSGKPAQHNGVDIGAPSNTPVIAPARGTVVVVRYDTNMGNVVKIDHGFDFQTEYRHLEKALVREGQSVKRGEIIGHVGNTGLLSTGPHLHYQVLVNDRAVNPQEFFFD